MTTHSRSKINSSSTTDHKTTENGCACGRECQCSLECPICFCVCNEAVETECCGQLFCKECIRRWRRHHVIRNASCPMCKVYNFKVHPATRLRRFIESQKKNAGGNNVVADNNNGTGTPNRNRTNGAMNRVGNVIKNAIAGVAGVSIGITAHAATITVPAQGILGWIGYTTTAPMFGPFAVAALGIGTTIGTGVVLRTSSIWRYLRRRDNEGST